MRNGIACPILREKMRIGLTEEEGWAGQMARPLWVTGFTCLIILLIAPLLPLNATLVLAGLGLVLLVISLLIPILRRQRVLWAALLAAVAAFGVYAGTEILCYRPLVGLDGRTVYLEARVMDREADTVLLEVTGGEAPKGSRIALYENPETELPDMYSLVAGDFVLTAKDAQGLDRLVMKASGVSMMAWCPEYGSQSYIETPGKATWNAVFSNMRQRFYHTLTAYLPGDRGELAAGICLGEDEGLSGPAKEAFHVTGVSHLLAVSGLHMSVLAFTLLALLWRMRIPECPASILTMAGVLWFMALVGFEVSVVRSGVMLLILLLGSAIRRRADSRNSMGFALLLLLLSDPYCAYDVGLLLSFGACLGLLCLYPWMRFHIRKRLEPSNQPSPELLPDAPAAAERPPFWRRGLIRLADALCVSVAAILPTMTVSAVFFGSLSLIAPITNLLTVFPSTLLTQLGCLAMVLEPIPFLFPVCRLLLMGVGWISGYLLEVTQWLARLPFASAAMREGYLLLWLPASLGMLYLGWRLGKAKGLRIAFATGVIALLCGINLRNLFMRNVTTIAAVGTNGDAAILLQRNGHFGAILSLEEFDSVNRLGFLLEEYGATRLDFLIVTGGEGNALLQIPNQLSDFLQETPLFYPESDPAFARLVQWYAYCMPIETAQVSFWQGDTLAWQDGWLRMTLGDTRVLLSSGGTDASQLPEDWRQTHLVVYTGTPPAHAGAITAQTGILLCEEEDLPYSLKAIPRTAYSVTAVSGYEQAAVVTRGEGDLTWDAWL